MVEFKQLKRPSWGGVFRCTTRRLLTAKQIELAFGKSITSGSVTGDSRTKWEWHFECDAGIVFRVYDWRSNISESGMYEWHIGAENHVDCEPFKIWFITKVMEAINASN